jgi:HAE1 family hydrophobic/amphiphilic exporter-1
MTSFAFIAGLIPLMFATGPGKVGNRTIGSAAFGGMLVGTLLGVILIPGLYYAFARTSERHPFHADVDDSPLSEVEQ